MSFRLNAPVSVLLLVSFAATAELTLSADQILLEVIPDVDRSLEDRAAIEEGFRTTIRRVWDELASEKPRFRCIGAKKAGQGVPGFKIGVLARRDTESIRQADVNVTVSMTWADITIKSHPSPAYGAAELPAESRNRALRDHARLAFEELVNDPKVDPCHPKAKVKGKSRMEVRQSGVTASFDGMFEGTGQLPIEEDGSFSAAIPILEKNLGGEVRMPGGECRASPFESRYTAVIAGAYDSRDGTLRFTKMQARDRTSTGSTMSCTINGRQFTAGAGPTPAGDTEDLAAGQDIRIAFQDGVRTLVPLRKHPGITQELSIELSFGASTAAPVLVAGRS